jgi:hypothetical protein
MRNIRKHSICLSQRTISSGDSAEVSVSQIHCLYLDVKSCLYWTCTPVACRVWIVEQTYYTKTTATGVMCVSQLKDPLGLQSVSLVCAIAVVISDTSKSHAFQGSSPNTGACIPGVISPSLTTMVGLPGVPGVTGVPGVSGGLPTKTPPPIIAVGLDAVRQCLT